MPNWALIIAIQEYSGAVGAIRQSLEGVHASAGKFYEWLREVKLVEPEHIFVCSDGMELPEGHPVQTSIEGATVKLWWGATRQDIILCIQNLLAVGRDATEHLFVFYSGHGFAYTSDVKRVGMSFLLTSEYVNPTMGGGACIDIDKLQLQLARSLSGHKHFHFVDACRNLIPASQIAPLSDYPILFETSDNGEADCFVLYSARYGDVARADPAFNLALIDGLKGKGYGKQWIGGEMWVTFEGICLQLESTLDHEFERRIAGSTTGKIYQLSSPPLQACALHIDAPVGEDLYDVEVLIGANRILVEKFHARDHQLLLEPSERPYKIRVTQAGRPLVQIAPPLGKNIDMYSECEMIFTPAPAHLGFGETLHEETTLPGNDDAWLYQISRPVSTNEPTIAKRLQKVIFPAKDLAGLEAFGNTDTDSTCLWLACAGVAVGQFGRETFTSELSRTLGLSLPPLEETQSVLLLLLITDNGTPSFSLNSSHRTQWTSMHEATEIPTLFHGWVTLVQGNHLLSVSLTEADPVTYATVSKPGHCTVVTARVADGLEVQQFFVPLSPLNGSDGHQTQVGADTKWTDYLHELEAVRIVSEAQTRFRRRKPVWRAGFANEALWDNLESGSWNDTELRALCAYDASRRGNKKDLATLLALPCEPTDALSADIYLLRGEDPGRPPLLLDALLRADELSTTAKPSEKKYKLPSGRLNFREMWISWSAVVEQQPNKSG